MAEKINHVNIGPPGTGKTTWLSRQIEKAFEKDHNITIISLTRSSAAEVAGRDLPIPDNQVGTLHSQCFRALRGVQIAESQKNIEHWNNQYPQFRISSVDEDGEDPLMEPEAALEGNAFLNEYNILRGRMAPRTTWSDQILAFATKWEAWKAEQDVLDFTDLIERCNEEIDQAPGNPSVIMIDEAQDMDRLEMALSQKWGQAAGNLVIVGDPDQCQPPGTLMQTAQGAIPIEDFDPRVHTLITWRPGHNRVQKQPADFPIKSNSRNFHGNLLRISTQHNSTRSTPDHIWYAKRTGPTPSPVILWISVHQDRWTAHADLTEYLESISGEKLPGRRHPNHRTWSLAAERTPKRAQALAKQINAQISLGATPQELLDHYHRDVSAPMLTQINSRQWLKGEHISLRAANLLPKVMALPVPKPDGTIEWHPIASIEHEPYEGPVYSFHIEPHKTYVADGILTHNCLYEWRGSDPTALMTRNMPEHTRSVLKQSYRLSQAVHRKALDWINSCPHRETVEYHPTENPGRVRYLPANYTQTEVILDDALQYIQDGKTVMLITSCAYMLDELIKIMRQSALPFHNPLRTRNGQWNPLARRTTGTSTTQRVLDFLHFSEYGSWNADQIRSWAGAVRLKEAFPGTRGMGKKLEELVDDDTSPENEPCISWDTLHNLLPQEAIDAALTGDLTWFEQRLAKARQGPATFPMNVIRRHGVDTLRQEPQLIPGTINSTKGGEADVVYLFPDLSIAGTEQWLGTSHDRAAIYRLFYVGMTRARDTLVLCEPVKPDNSPEFWQGD